MNAGNQSAGDHYSYGYQDAYTETLNEMSYGHFPIQSQQGGFWGTMPRRGRGRGGPRGGRQGVSRGAKRPQQKENKQIVTAGKTPAMVAHELLPGITESYEPLDKAFKCTITWHNQTFDGISQSKKNAKQVACSNALRALRPDINVEELMPPLTEPKMPAIPANLEKGDGAPPTKRKKVMTVEAADSLNDLLHQCCQSQKMTTTFDFTEVNPDNTDPKTRTFVVTLCIPEGGHVFKAEGVGKTLMKEKVVRQALKEVIKLTEEQIIGFFRRSLYKRNSNDPVTTLRHMVDMLGYTQVSVEYEEGKSEPGYLAVYVIRDYDGVDHKMKGPVCRSKSLARDRGASQVLEEMFGVRPDSLQFRPTSAFVPSQYLMTLASRQKPQITLTYTDAGMTEQKEFLCKLQMTPINKEFTGTGKSKKEAKNAAAALALQDVFQVDIKEGCLESAVDGGDTAKGTLGQVTAAYVLREYKMMCDFYGVKKSDDFCGFLFVNSRDEKRIVSFGSAQQSTAPPAVLKSKGKGLVHMNSVVLARRGFVRYLIHELDRAVKDPEGAMLVLGEDGLYHLKEDLRLVIFYSKSIDVRHSSFESPDKSLSVYGQFNIIEKVPPQADSQTAAKDGFLRVHTIADKLYKWSTMGVCGSLLTSRVHPILPFAVYLGVKSNVMDVSIRSALFDRLGEHPMPHEVESCSLNYDDCGSELSTPHVWARISMGLELLARDGSATKEGNASVVSKREIFKAFADTTEMKPGTTYAEAKRNSSYTSAKEIFYSRLEKEGLGSWYRMPPCMDDFSLDSSTTA